MRESIRDREEAVAGLENGKQKIENSAEGPESEERLGNVR